MVVYKLTVYTGNRLMAGTIHHIYIQLFGTNGLTQQQSLNGCTILAQGSVNRFDLHTDAPLGDLISMKLYSKAFLTTEDEWFCDKISVTTPESAEVLFPCYRWLHRRTKMTLVPATATFVFTNPMNQRQRMSQLNESRRNFGWSLYAQGLPQVISYKTPFDLPAEVQFSFTKDTEFVFTALQQIIILKLTGWTDSKSQWKSFRELDEILLQPLRSQTYEYIQKHWKEDKFFGYQLLNGINPMMIQRCSKLPENFPVTEKMVKDSLRGRSLEVEMKNGNIFLCDYKILDGLMGNVVNGRQQYLTAPLVLLYCNPEGSMLPIAIQLGQKAGVNPIFIPTDPEHDWLLAKIFVRNAEFSVHEVDFHLLRTHLLAEVFTMATLRNLPTMHPLFKLLFPHIRYTLQINIMARNRLISKDGSITLYAAIGGDSVPKLLRRATASLTYSSLCLPDNISERGLEKVPNYYYREDGMRLWNIINEFVERVLTHYYKSDGEVKNDSELQCWIKEIFCKGFLKRKSTEKPQSLKDLVKFVTMVIFTASAQHASVNNGQFEFGCWMPNFPSALREPPPNEKGQTTEQTILETLPDVSTTVHTMAVLRLLSSISSDHYPLGYFPEEWFEEEVPCKLIKKFQVDLKSLSDLIKKRNATLELPYTYLDPENVDNSVAI
ncbi:hydroperoxide isomerase ALOXE3-like [Clupea harengus]|uniref:Hydroperoxide isomerase ALOXE3-like n=1 Tax=Clupea harengus TaxID=7950 RepID=A0A6P8EZI0_CLUHA|nr:hydroperoxide isomerase ALOXE3-like [Clupea harengus]